MWHMYSEWQQINSLQEIKTDTLSDVQLVTHAELNTSFSMTKRYF